MGVGLNEYLRFNADLVNLRIYPQPQAPLQGLGSQTRHFLVLAGESKPKEKKWALYSAVHHVGEMLCQTYKKKDTSWKNIPPGKFDPYVCMHFKA